MGAVGGSAESATFAGRTFSVISDADLSRMLGGSENEVVANGDGTSRIIKTRVPPKFDGLGVAIDDLAGDQEYLQQLADGNEFFAMSITLASGQVWQGEAQIVGEIAYSTQSASATLSIAGQGKFTRQV